MGEIAMTGKTVSHSQSMISNVMLPQHANQSGNVHGGEIMKMMDSTAGVVARRHSRCNVVTARVDELQFHLPVHIGDVVTCHGKLTFVGKSSMEISITVTVEDVKKDEPAQKALSAFFTFVALDDSGKSQRVPPLVLETEEERRLYEQGRQRYLAYKQGAVAR
jgi:acyl-CoA hydrolase